MTDTAADAPPSTGLSEAQAAVYDRQLRVWGVEVQNRLTAARVLVVGGGGLAAEAAKNLVLAGVGHLALLDDTPTSSASRCNFLVPSTSEPTTTTAEASVCTLQAMNPLVKVTCEGGPTAQLAAPVLRNYDLVLLAHDPGFAELERLDVLCKELGVLLLAAAARGPLGYFFVNLHDFKYTVKAKAAAQPSGATAPAAAAAAPPPAPPAGPLDLRCVSLREALAVPLSKMTARTHPLYPVLRVAQAFERIASRPPGLDDVAALTALASTLAAAEGAAPGGPGVARADLLEQYATGGGAEEELAPMCAILGGLLANTVVRAISRVGVPLKSLFFYGLFDSVGIIEDLGC